MKKRSFYRAIPVIIIIVAAVMIMITFSGCDANGKQNQKTLSLSEYLEESNENWFLTGKKEYTIQAMMVSKEMTFLLLLCTFATSDLLRIIIRSQELRIVNDSLKNERPALFVS